MSSEFELHTARRRPAAFSCASAAGTPANMRTAGSISRISWRTWAMMAGSFQTGTSRNAMISRVLRWRSCALSAALALRKPYLSATPSMTDSNQGRVSASVPSKSNAASRYFMPCRRWDRRGARRGAAST
ncbi:Uncharacterised protein [Bordetella pertussis]|nr:Uncharacterised protein [Bordetella pertussis]